MFIKFRICSGTQLLSKYNLYTVKFLKKTAMKNLITILIAAIPYFTFAQSGIVNNGGIIHIYSGSYLTIGNQNSNLLNKDDGTNTGKMINDGAITLNGNWTNNASYSSTNGTVIFKGDNTTVNGTNITTFKNINVDKLTTSSQLFLTKNMAVTGNLTMNTGDIYLNNHNLNLGLTGSVINETNDNKLFDHYTAGTGTITANRINLTPSSGETFGNIGIKITSSQNFGNTIITRSHKQQVSVINGTAGVYKYFDIVPTNNVNLNATLRMYYLDEEIPMGMNESDFAFYNSTDNGGTWFLQNGTVSMLNNYIELTGINEFSRWTISDKVAAPLPIELLSFDANRVNKMVYLKWSTVSEINNQGFEIERTTDLTNWDNIGFVNGAGNSNEILNYSFDDPLSDAIFKNYQHVYYRLKQVDFDGSYTYTNIKNITLNDNESSEIMISVFPNPSSDFVNIVSNLSSAEYLVSIFTQEGLLIGSTTMYGSAFIDVRKMKSSNYNFVITEKETGKRFDRKVVVL